MRRFFHGIILCDYVKKGYKSSRIFVKVYIDINHLKYYNTYYLIEYAAKFLHIEEGTFLKGKTK